MRWGIKCRSDGLNRSDYTRLTRLSILRGTDRGEHRERRQELSSVERTNRASYLSIAYIISRSAHTSDSFEAAAGGSARNFVNPGISTLRVSSGNIISRASALHIAMRTFHRITREFSRTKLTRCNVRQIIFLRNRSEINSYDPREWGNGCPRKNGRE